MKLSEWAKQKGVSYKTAWRLVQAGIFPEQIEQLPTGTYIIGEKETKTIPQQGAIYARVSSHDQKEDLQRQLQRLREYAKSNQLIIRKEVFEIASGLNGLLEKLYD